MTLAKAKAKAKTKLKHIYSTGIIYDHHLRSSKYFYSYSHWYCHEALLAKAVCNLFKTKFLLFLYWRWVFVANSFQKIELNWQNVKMASPGNLQKSLKEILITRLRSENVIAHWVHCFITSCVCDYIITSWFAYRTERIRHLCWKTAVLSCRKCIKTLVLKKYNKK